MKPLTVFPDITTGRVYSEVINKERRGDYLGANAFKSSHTLRMKLKNASSRRLPRQPIRILSLQRLEGTVGDIESLPFLRGRAIRQMRSDVGSGKCSLYPYHACSLY